MTIVQLTWAGVSDDKACQTKGNIGGSTCTWLDKPEGCQGLERRGSVVGGPPRACYLLARSRSSGRSTNGSRRSRLERLPVRHLGTPTSSGKGALKSGTQVAGGRFISARGSARRHPGCCPWPANFLIRHRSRRCDPVQIMLSTREGDVPGDVAGRPCCRLAGGGRLVAIEAAFVGRGSREILDLTIEGDVQGDVVRSCSARMDSPTLLASRTRRSEGTSS
jgi:hypothetical protein